MFRNELFPGCESKAVRAWPRRSSLLPGRYCARVPVLADRQEHEAGQRFRYWMPAGTDNSSNSMSQQV